MIICIKKSEEEAKKGPQPFVHQSGSHESEEVSADPFVRIQSKIVKGFKFVMESQPDLFLSFLNQLSPQRQKNLLERFLPEFKRIDIHTAFKPLLTEPTSSEPIVKLIIDYTSYPSIEFFVACLSSLEEDLYSLKENPASLEAKCSENLLKKLIPFKKILCQPTLSDEIYASNLIEISNLLKSERDFLHTRKGARFYAASSSAIINILNKTIDHIDRNFSSELLERFLSHNSDTQQTKCAVM